MRSVNKNFRAELLEHILWFVPAVAKIQGVRQIKLLGSMITQKKNPKDIDFLVVVEDDADLEPLARLGRRAQGRAQQIGRGADIFLANVQGKYIGRTCHWKDCRPGIRLSCDALHCGKRPYLHDDLKTIRLSDEAMRSALELWPRLEMREGMPLDLEGVVRKLE